MTTEVTISFTPEEVRRLKVALQAAVANAASAAARTPIYDEAARLRLSSQANYDLLARVRRAS